MERIRFWFGSLFFLVILTYILDPIGDVSNFEVNAKKFKSTNATRIPASLESLSDLDILDYLEKKYESLPEPNVEAEKKVEMAISRFNAVGSSSIKKESEICNCSIGGENKNEVSYDSYESAACSSEKEGIVTVKENGLKTEKNIKGNRNYLRTALAQLPDDYRLRRGASPEAQFPQACMVFIMKDFLGFMKVKTEDAPSSIFVTCANAKGKPVRGAMKPCVTTDYVSSVYNSLVDVSDCLGVPQKDFVPKIYNESGFHGVSFGAGDDTGVGQLTGAAIEDVNMNMSTYKNLIHKSSKASCQRLKKVPDIFKEIDRDSDKRCSLISPPSNPMRNVLYSGILYKQNRLYVDNSMKKFDIEGLMKKAGMTEYDKDEVKRMMTSLGYNAGPTSAVLYLKNYLEDSIQAIQAGKRKGLTTADFDFRKGFELIDKTKAAGKDPKDIPVSELTLPEYLRIHSQTGAPGYLSFLQRMHQRLTNVFGEGTCSPAGYLVL